MKTDKEFRQLEFFEQIRYIQIISEEKYPIDEIEAQLKSIFDLFDIEDYKIISIKDNIMAYTENVRPYYIMKEFGTYHLNLELANEFFKDIQEYEYCQKIEDLKQKYFQNNPEK